MTNARLRRKRLEQRRAWLARAVVPFLLLIAGCQALPEDTTKSEVTPAATTAAVIASPPAQLTSPAGAPALSPAPKAASPVPGGKVASPVSAPQAVSPSPAPTNSETVTVKRGQPIKIGFAADLSGQYAGFGVDERRGAELALEDVKDVKGFPVQLVTEDDQCSAEGGARVAQKMVADREIVGVIGHLCTDASVAASTIYEPNGLVMISPSSSAPNVTARGLAVVNRVIWNDEIQGSAAARYVRETLRLTTAAVIHDGTPYGQGVADAFRRELERLGGRVVGLESITVGDTEFRSVLTRVSAGQPELIYFGGSEAEAALLASQRAELRLSAQLMGPDGVYTKRYIEVAGPAAEGTYATFAEMAAPPSPSRADFDRRYQAKYNQHPDEAGPFHYQAYDATHLLLTKLGEVATVTPAGDLEIGRNALARALRATNGYQGLSGSITCRPNGDCATANVQMNVVRNGEWQKAP